MINRFIIPVVLLGALAVGVASYQFVDKNKKSQQLTASLDALQVTLLETAKDIGTFTLIDGDGQPFQQSDLQGNWSLLFFGFTHCPEFCPNTLVTLNAATQIMDKDNSLIPPNIYMVSVDPARDTPARLKDYVPNICPSAKGLTGEISSITALSKQFYATFERVNMSMSGDDNDYMINHSSQIFIINPDGKYVGYAKPPFHADGIVAISQLMAANF